MSCMPKILVVDDRAANRRALRTALGDIGATIVEASNGFDALALTLDEEFALILLDVQMPEMDGFEVCERLAANPQTAETPVILVTAASHTHEDRLHGYLRGATDYLSKPINDQILRAKTQVFLRLYRQNRALQTALETARIAEKVKDSFLANVSHELRTPLNAVIGLSALALGGGSEARQREYLEKIRDAGQTLLAIINDLLDLTRIAAGEMPFETTPFSVRQLVARVGSVIGHQAAEKGLGLESLIDQRLPEILLGDPLRIEQILLNLLNNSIKFTERGGIVVRVTVEGNDGVGARLLLEVEDSGIGMNADETAHIYLPFVQADSSITRKHGGTGLGLAICKQLAEGMAGSIEVSSRPGSGTRFAVRLPLALADPQARLAGDEPADLEQLPTAYRNARVLVVDDQALNREIVFELLATVGIVPQLAENGREALNMLAAAGAQAFDLVLMDIQMPVLDGLAATRAIRALPGFATLPIIAMTAHTMVHEKQDYLDRGMNDHLGKPFSLPAFFALLARWLPRPPDPVAAPRTPADEDALAAIAGLDRDAALQRFAGNRERYRYWLEEFVVQAPAFATGVDRLLADGAREAARQAVHAFRGRVGMLGMGGIDRLAAALEQAISADQASEGVRRQLAQAIDGMCEALRASLPPSRAQAAAAAAPDEAPAAAPPSIAALLQLLEAADGNSAAAIAGCLAEFADSRWEARLQAALSAVQEFDFEAAREWLAEPRERA
jgi:signal transduction histidine kinase/HPt (histidine-containing phosphotransfer) domain-containing protein